MTLSSLRYNAAKQRFKTKSISKPISKPVSTSDTIQGDYDGFNPETGMQKFKTKSGGEIEAINNNQHTAYASKQSILISQNHVIG